MITRSGELPSGSITLSPEILLKIFLYLDCQTIIRSVCKEFLEIIDNNKSLWKALDWIQERDGSSLEALEKFDEKSGSTLKKVSIFQGEGELNHEHLLELLNRSKKTLTNLSLKLSSLESTFCLKVMELATNFHSLNTLVLWSSGRYSSSIFPRTRLIRSSRHPYQSTERSSNLQVLWCFNLVQNLDGKLDVSSLVSFADPCYCDSLQLRSILSKFSKTLVHLSIDLDNGITPPSLACPSLRILEGHFNSEFPSWLDAPNLQIVIAGKVGGSFIRDLPVSVQELWLLSTYNYNPPARANFWQFLPLVCPKLTVIKISRDYCQRAVVMRESLEALRLRQDKVKEGVEIGGIKMRSLEKVIVPTELLEPAQLSGLREIVDEVIDIDSYPDFIEIKY